MPGGGMFPAGDVDPGPTIFTHPKDSFGQLEFVALDDLWRELDPRFAPAWSPTFWRDDHPLGIESVAYFTTIATDLERARALYEGPIDGRVLDAEASAAGESAFVVVGSGSIVELAKPTVNNSRLAAELAANGELLHGCTLHGGRLRSGRTPHRRRARRRRGPIR
jgi:hypothetical protein